MSGQALYRKYRSANFSEVVGQEHVVRTLTAAIASGHLSHAYLFTGPRGVGKTSVARLLARALNCTGDPKPCNQCANCLAAINSSLDVIEIDAASNRSIDAIRELREKIGLAPTQGMYKIYIIDEVHMLTTEAFNALLKTLEEPPAHVVFILATTEAHKLPDTIISRTQRFSFKAPTLTDISALLSQVAEAEQLKVEPAALEIIATSARGSFRDALSLLDQLAASGTSPLTATDVRALLGYSDAEDVASLARAIANRNTKVALELAARLETGGAQAAQVATQLTELWRAVMLTAAGASTAPNEAVQQLAADTPPAAATRVITTLIEVTRSPWPQLTLEAALVTLTTAPTATTPIATPRPPAASSSALPAPPQSAAVPAAATAPTTSPKPAVAASTKPGLKPELWPKVLVLVKAHNNSLYALLQMYPVDFGDGEVTIKPRFNFHRDLFAKPANRGAIEAAATKVYGRPVRVSARTDESGQASKRPRRPTGPDPSAELISSALEILGGEIVE